MATKPTDDELFNMLKKAYSGSGANIGPRAPLSDEMLRRIQKSVDSANKSSQKKKTGGSVKGVKEGGDVGMHRMPDGKMMKDSAHKKYGDQDAPKRKSPEMKTMPNIRPVPKDAKFGDQDAPKRKSPYMKKLKGGGGVRGGGIAERGTGKGRMC